MAFPTVDFICSTFVMSKGKSLTFSSCDNSVSLIPVYKRILKMTAEEKRFQEKIRAIQDTMFVIGGKWKLPVVLSIYSGNKRFNDIAASIPKITNRVLSKELKHLEENLLISRTVIDDYPVRIEYSVTDYCLSIGKVVKSMESWGKQHKEKITGKC
jgi:DNA-binding HxlR family transcriptional regulator